MLARPNTVVAVLRAETTDPEGEPLDDDSAEPVQTGVPASILTRSRTVQVPGSTTPRTIRWFIGRVPAGTDIQNGDRLRDRENRVYAVDSVDQAPTTGRVNDLRLELRRLA